MSWTDEVDGATPLERLLGNRPELLKRYQLFQAALHREAPLPPRTLGLCRQRIAAIHGCPEQWDANAGAPPSEAEAAALAQGDFSVFFPEEQAALAIAEQFPFHHHEVSDAAVAQAERVFTPRGAVALLVALAFFDVTCRWKLAFAVDEPPAQLKIPPLNSDSAA